MSPESVSVEWMGRSFHIGAGTSSGMSVTRAVEAESIRSRAESTGGCVKLKTVTGVRQSKSCKTFMTESVYLVVTDLWE